MVNKPVEKKVPTMSAPKEVYIENLSQYTIAKLYEMRDRQAKLLLNKTCLRNLADRGERIKSLHQRILKEIENRNEIEEAAAKFSALNIVSNGVPAMTALEWSSGKSIQPPDTVLDSDDEEDDPLKLLAQSRAVKLVKVEKPAETLITQADLDDIASFEKDEKTKSDKQETKATIPTSVASLLEPHAVYACGLDATFNKNVLVKPKYKPYKTTKSDVHSIEKEKARKVSDKWEVTAATPPVIRNSDVRVLTLQESIEIQRQQYEKSKTMQEEVAQTRLRARQKIVADNIHLLPPGSGVKDTNDFFRNYRDKREESDNDDDNESDDDDDDDDDYDDDDDDRGGVVIRYAE